MQIRLVALDLDGTLLKTDRKPHADAVDAIRALAADGMHVALASGRHFSSIEKVVEEIGIPMHIVANNGCFVRTAEGENLHIEYLAPDCFRSIIEYGRSSNLQLVVSDESGIHINEVPPWDSLYAERLGNITPSRTDFDGFLNLKAIKALIIDEPENLKAHLSRFHAELESKRLRYTFSEAEYLEFLPYDGDKGKGLNRLARRLGLEPGEVAAIGDWLNDLEMLEWCGYGCSVENAHPTIRERARRVFSSNDRGGVAEFLASIV